MTSPGISTVRCPAKINLGLRVLRRRSDGYHELLTVFQAVDLWDELHGRLADELSLSCSDPAIPDGEENLVLRAARVLQRESRCSRGAALELTKRIPAGGGLGGGSSDAAGALILLSRLWELPVSRDTLTRLGAEIGADVPFFLSGGTALARGRGDRVEPLAPARELPLVLGLAPFGVSTPEVFRRFAAMVETGREPLPSEPETALTPSVNDVSLTRLLALKLPGGNDFAVGVNDLERVVFEGWPELRSFRDSLIRVGARCAMLSGSGSTVFGLFEDGQAARAAAEQLADRHAGWRIEVSRLVRQGLQPGDTADDRRG